MTLPNDQLEAQMFNSFITIIHMYLFRPLTDSDDTTCCINTIWLPEDEQDIARNMYM
jgi:hypothetical protein